MKNAERQSKPVKPTQAEPIRSFFTRFKDVLLSERPIVDPEFHRLKQNDKGAAAKYAQEKAEKMMNLEPTIALCDRWFVMAAELFEGEKDYKNAAPNYMRAGRTAKAGLCFLKAGDAEMAKEMAGICVFKSHFTFNREKRLSLVEAAETIYRELGFIEKSEKLWVRAEKIGKKHSDSPIEQ